jgi:lysophospholipase L1-like esterase
VLLTMPACNSEAVYRKVVLDGHRGTSPPFPESFDRFKADFGAYNAAIRQVGAETGVAVVDMNQLFGGDEQFFADVVHYNAKGSQRFGELAAGALAPMVNAQSGAPAAARP